jgi:hypothetical protein
MKWRKYNFFGHGAPTNDASDGLNEKKRDSLFGESRSDFVAGAGPANHNLKITTA